MKVIDLFAGTGWGVACKERGLDEYGVDNMQAVIDTRHANDMPVLFDDVMKGLLGVAYVPGHEMEIASPPCQTYSMAGNGKGREALNEVTEAIRTGAHKDVTRLLQFGMDHDYRTSLVLTPLAYAHKYRPRLIVWEQVPAVLPVWEQCAYELHAMGYSVTTGILSAEQYGVPQARKRAVLVARNDGKPAVLPTPTHSKYHRTRPDHTDPGTLPWVSMADALGWGFTERPSPTYCNSGNGGAGIEWGGNSIRKTMREQSLNNDRWKNKDGVEPGTNDSIRVTVREAAALQTYPADFNWRGTKTKQYIQIGNAVPPLLGGAILDVML